MAFEFTDEELQPALMANALFMQSKAFRRSSDILSSKVNFSEDHEMLHLLFINMVFAIELALKSVILSEGGTPKKTHQIKSLIPQLSKVSLDKFSRLCQEKKVGEWEFNVITEFTDGYTVQRYNEACIVFTSEEQIYKIHEAILEVAQDFIETSKILKEFNS